MVQWWIERFRDHEADRTAALKTVTRAAEADRRKALADYDSFVPSARAITEGLLLGTGTSSSGEKLPIRLAWDDEYPHWLVQGGTGTGKTTWTRELLRQELAHGRPVGVIDGKGDLFRDGVRTIAALGHALDPVRREELRKRLVVVNPFADCLVPLNVCRPLPGCSAEVQAYEVTLALSRLFDSALGVHMESILRHLVLLLIEGELSLVEAPQLLEDELLRGVLATRSSNPAVRDFFLNAWASVPQVSKDALASRLRALLLPENVRLMLGADDVLDLRAVLENGQPLFVFLGKGPGVPEEQVDILGNLFLQLLLQAVWSRGTGSERPYLLALDEFVHLLGAPALTKRFETALTMVRSFGLALMLIHQNFAQLPAALREIILGNCDHVALFRTSGRNAGFFGDFLPEIEPDMVDALPRGRGPSGESTRRRQLEALQRLPDRHLFWYDRRRSWRALRLRAQDVVPPHVSVGLTRSQFEDLIERQGWTTGSAGVPRAELKSQVEVRQRRLAELVRPTIPISERKSGTPGTSKKGARPKLG